jgi:BirA family biotin operon repressor/biotin-[acetyl-CoA-carboxylase] ligase
MPIGQHILHLPEVDSTSSEARRHIAAGPCHGLVIRADVQTAGHGRFGRTWRSPAGRGLLTSVVVADGRTPGGGRTLTAAGALAAVEAAAEVLSRIETTGARRIEPHRPEIHWPNDVYLMGRKLAGVLVEQADGPGGVHWIVGIGINVKGRVESLETAIAMEEACGGRPIAVDDVARSLYARFDTWLDRLTRHGVKPLAEAWRKRSGLLGRRVRLVLDGEARLVRVQDIDPERGLVVLTDSGATIIAPPERTTGVEVVG